MNLFRIVNLAAIARTSMRRLETASPIADAPAIADKYIDRMVGIDTSVEPRPDFHRKKYPDEALDTFVKSRGLVELLLDHVPVWLLDTSASMTERMYVIKSDFDIESVVESMGVNGSEIKTHAKTRVLGRRNERVPQRDK